ncbi:MAG: 5-formyltetrahydrofolate cyclo-ligase [Oscillospiraceae bacterium]|nr:5-formyltetrahydrofolate cyclo-ligase [Oscillospiraceae bacterium]
MQEINIRKNELRKRLKELRKGLDPRDKAKMDMSIAQNLFSLKGFTSAQKFLCYISEKTEVDTEDVINRLLEQNKVVAAPKLCDSEGNMNFHIITSLSQTQKSSFGVREPNADACNKLDDFSNSVCILPALAFDKSGFRLGYGKGCYDRFLSSYNGLKIGVCYENCIFDNLPKDKFDITADIVVTENEIFYIKKETGE